MKKKNHITEDQDKFPLFNPNKCESRTKSSTVIYMIHSKEDVFPKALIGRKTSNG